MNLRFAICDLRLIEKLRRVLGLEFRLQAVSGSSHMEPRKRGTPNRSTVKTRSFEDFWKSRLVCLGAAFLPYALFAQEPPPPLLRPPHPELSPTFWELHGGQIILTGVLVLVLVLLIILWAYRSRPIVVDPPGVTARRALEKLRGRAEDGALIVEVSRILKRFVLAALNLPPEQEQTTAEFRNFLKAGPQFRPDLAEDVGDFLRRCDEWKFAPSRPAPQLNAVPRALELVERVEASRETANEATKEPPVISARS